MKIAKRKHILVAGDQPLVVTQDVFGHRTVINGKLTEQVQINFLGVWINTEPRDLLPPGGWDPHDCM